MEYVLELVEEKVKRHQVTAMHLTCALAFIGGGSIIYVFNDHIKPWGLFMLLSGIALLLLTIVKNKLVTAPPNNTIFRIVELCMSAALCVYSVFQHWNLPIGIYGVLAAGLGYAMFWERSAGGKQCIYVSEEGIKLPIDSRKRFIEWAEIETVIFKFGTLSIDCVDNRLLQWNMQSVTFETDGFEAFCNTQIAHNKGKRRNDDW